MTNQGNTLMIDPSNPDCIIKLINAVCDLVVNDETSRNNINKILKEKSRGKIFIMVKDGTASPAPKTKGTSKAK